MTSEFAQQIALLCSKHSASVTSWIRTQRRNAAVGGSPNSAHTLGLAMDLVPDFDEDRKREEIAIDARRMGLWAKVASDHVHIQAIPPKIGSDDAK